MTTLLFGFARLFIDAGGLIRTCAAPSVPELQIDGGKRFGVAPCNLVLGGGGKPVIGRTICSTAAKHQAGVS
ncbi:hypothetical protein [Agrobacterium sp. T29]|uniref:hypothetical protein n=1 Tax=Agrobacterium sp. T29 TaxID=2580515 RepID=UPI00143D16CC|nr:hypothetical protein [Agrobacterium sp. T29]